MENPLDRARALLRFGRRNRVSVILQNEAAECGIACLAMIVGFHGHPVSLHTLRQMSGVSIRGATLNQLIQAAAILGLSARPLRLELEHLKDLRLPCILHWNQSHFVVLKKVTRQGIAIVDPASGERWISMRDVDGSFTGVALELSPTATFAKATKEPGLAVSQLWSRISGFWSSISQVLLLSFGALLISILTPYYAQLVIDEAVSSHDTSLLNTLAIGFALLLIVQVAIGALRSLVVLVLSNQLSIQIASNLFFHLMRLPIDYFEKRHVGDIASRFTSLDRIREQITSTALEAIIDGILVIATLAMMFLYSVQLTLIVIGCVVLYFAARGLTFRPMRRATEEQIVANAKKDTSLIESIRSMSGIKLYGREPQRMALWQNHLADGLNAGIRTGKFSALLSASNQFIFGAEKIIVIFLAAKLIMVGQMSVGELMAFIAYKTQFTDKASGLVDKWQLLRLTGIHLDRVADIVFTPLDTGNIAHVAPSFEGPASGHMQLENVTFRYGANDTDILRGITLDIAPGESVAIVGGSGQGKTTLLKILLGLLRPCDGRVLVDGHDIWAQGHAASPAGVAAVLQDESPLSGTIAENIAFFDEDIDMDRVLHATMAAGLHADIMRMPMNYQSLIGDMGSALSGGQRQRLLIARALYREPSIIIMDEATSNLDVLTERMVSTSIKELKITRILVAHRPETIHSADRVLALENGLIRELQLDELAQSLSRVGGLRTDALVATP